MAMKLLSLTGSLAVLAGLAGCCSWSGGEEAGTPAEVTAEYTSLDLLHVPEAAEVFSQGAIEKSSLQFFWDDSNLYIAAEVKDENLFANAPVSPADDDGVAGDRVEVTLATADDTYLWKGEFNVAGRGHSRLLPAEGISFAYFDTDWPSRVVSYRGTINDWSDRDEGYQLLIAVPWRDLLVKNGQTPETVRLLVSAVIVDADNRTGETRLYFPGGQEPSKTGAALRLHY